MPPPGADVRSLQALRDWFAALSLFHKEAREALASVGVEVQRAPDWVEQKGREWQAKARRAEESLFRAKMELAQRQHPDFSGRIPDTTVQEKAVRRAEAELEFCQEQIRVCQRWLNELPEAVGEVYHGPARRLGFFLESDAVKALAELDRQIAALEQYQQESP